MDWTAIALAGNAVIALAYFGISGVIAVPLLRSGQVRANRLGTATAVIFFSCAVGHGLHALATYRGLAGAGAHPGHLDSTGWSWPSALWDLFTAAVGVYYWTLRRTYGALMSGAKLFDDLRERQRQALEINDGIVQGLATAKLALELDQQSVTREALESTLASARGLITELLGEVTDHPTFAPGELRRSRAALLRKT